MSYNRWLSTLLYAGMSGVALLSFYLLVMRLLTGDWATTKAALVSLQPSLTLMIASFSLLRGTLHYLRHSVTPLHTTSAATSTTSMLLCCAHHVVDIFPLLSALTGMLPLLTWLQIPSLLLATSFNVGLSGYAFWRSRSQ